MPKAETITWRDLTGNKFNRSLHPAMLHNDGYVCQSAVRRIGEAEKTIFKIIYDREYLIEYVGRTVCKQLFVVGKEETLNLVSEAWDNYYPNTVRRAVRPVADR